MQERFFTRMRPSRRVFVILNTLLMLLFAFICLAPFLNLLAVSLSSSVAAQSGKVGFVPIGFTFEAYKYLVQRIEFFRAFGISVLRVVTGTVLSLTVMLLAAYPLALGNLRGRGIYVGLFTLSMFFSGGLVPTYLVITGLGLYNSIFALILPTAANAWNLVLLINFFRQVPSDLVEYAHLEGAGHLRVLVQIVMPVSLPAIATVILFTAVAHWNAWFDGIIYMQSERYPLQTYIYNIINQLNMLTSGGGPMTPEQQQALANLPDKTVRAAQIFIAMLPILILYPFAQKFFIKGLVMGSVKG